MQQRLRARQTELCAGLWLLEIAALAFVCGGILILVFDPSNWLIALLSIGAFGLCAVAFARMLFLRGHGGLSPPWRRLKSPIVPELRVAR